VNIKPTNVNRPAPAPGVEPASAARPESAAAAQTAPAGRAGSIELSAEALTFLRLRDRLASTSGPDLEQRIARLGSSIQTGTYQVSGESIAAAMLRDPAIEAMLDVGARKDG
jgi:anti-sigma28 factor (negative regulator of flagellin synthesis)